MEGRCGAPRRSPSTRLARKSLAASEAVFQGGRLIHKSKMNYSSWVWDHKVAKEELFEEIKELLRFPDGRVPRKNKLRGADVEARLREAGAYTQAVVLLAQRVWGEAEAARAASSDGALRGVKFFHRSVLPEFVAWLYWPERLQAMQQARLSWCARPRPEARRPRRMRCRVCLIRRGGFGACFQNAQWSRSRDCLSAGRAAGAPGHALDTSH